MKTARNWPPRTTPVQVTIGDMLAGCQAAATSRMQGLCFTAYALSVAEHIAFAREVFDWNAKLNYLGGPR